MLLVKYAFVCFNKIYPQTQANRPGDCKISSIRYGNTNHSNYISNFIMKTIWIFTVYANLMADTTLCVMCLTLIWTSVLWRPHMLHTNVCNEINNADKHSSIYSYIHSVLSGSIHKNVYLTNGPAQHKFITNFTRNSMDIGLIQKG